MTVIKNTVILIVCLVYGTLCFAQSSVTVYTEPGCTYCKHLEQGLVIYNVKYREINDVKKVYKIHPVTIIKNSRSNSNGLTVVYGDNLLKILTEVAA